MTIAQQESRSSIQYPKSIESRGFKPAQQRAALAKKLWWHTHGYGTVFGVLLLTLGSLIFLLIDWFFNISLSSWTNPSIKEKEAHK